MKPSSRNSLASGAIALSLILTAVANIGGCTKDNPSSSTAPGVTPPPGTTPGNMTPPGSTPTSPVPSTPTSPGNSTPTNPGNSTPTNSTPGTPTSPSSTTPPMTAERPTPGALDMEPGTYPPPADNPGNSPASPSGSAASGTVTPPG